MRRLERDHLAVVGNGAVMVLFIAGVDAGALVVELDVVWIERNRLAVVGDDPLAQLPILADVVRELIEVTTGPPGAGEIGLELDRGVDVGQRLLPVACPIVQATAHKRGRGLPRIEPARRQNAIAGRNGDVTGRTEAITYRPVIGGRDGR